MEKEELTLATPHRRVALVDFQRAQGELHELLFSYVPEEDHRELAMRVAEVLDSLYGLARPALPGSEVLRGEEAVEAVRRLIADVMADWRRRNEEDEG